jgi:hypothetical protein
LVFAALPSHFQGIEGKGRPMQDEFLMRLWNSDHERASHDLTRRLRAPAAKRSGGRSPKAWLFGKANPERCG